MTLTDARVGDPRIAVVETFGTLDSNGESELPETYVLSQVDIDAGRVENTAVATGTSPGGALGDVTGHSGPGGTAVDDDVPTLIARAWTASITFVKTVDDSVTDDGPNSGKKTVHAFRIFNTGNVTLGNVSVTEKLDRAVLAGDPIPLLPPDATDASETGADVHTAAYGATYAIDRDDIDAREVIYDASVSGGYGPVDIGPKPVPSLTASVMPGVTAMLNAIGALSETYPEVATGGVTPDTSPAGLGHAERFGGHARYRPNPRHPHRHGPDARSRARPDHAAPRTAGGFSISIEGATIVCAPASRNGASTTRSTADRSTFATTASPRSAAWRSSRPVTWWASVLTRRSGSGPRSTIRPISPAPRSSAAIRASRSARGRQGTGSPQRRGRLDHAVE